jgi:hypothetical protein
MAQALDTKNGSTLADKYQADKYGKVYRQLIGRLRGEHEKRGAELQIGEDRMNLDGADVQVPARVSVRAISEFNSCKVLLFQEQKDDVSLFISSIPLGQDTPFTTVSQSQCGQFGG